MAARERLHRALAGLSAEAQSIIFDVRADGVSWAEVARERGITIDQARYIYQRAVAQMEEVFNRDDSEGEGAPPGCDSSRSRPARRRLERGGSAVDDVSPDTCDQQWKSLEKRLDAGGDGEPVHEQPDGPPSSSLAGSATAVAPHAARSLLGSIVGEGLALGAVISYLLQPLHRPGRLPRAPDRTDLHARQDRSSGQQQPPRAAAHPCEPREPDGPAGPDEPDDTHEHAGAARAALCPRQGARERAKAAPPRSAPYDAGSMALIDQARSTLVIGRLSEARELSAQHARQYQEQHHAEARRELLRMICAKPGEHGAPECPVVRSTTAPN